MKSNNKIEAIIYLILVLVLCASLVGVITSITKEADKMLNGGGDDKPSTTTTIDKTTTTKPTETTKPVETTQKPAETTGPVHSDCEHENWSDEYRYVSLGNGEHVREWACSDCGEFISVSSANAMPCIFANGVCVNCKYPCSHMNNDGFSYIYNGNDKHYEIAICDVCDIEMSSFIDDCDYGSGVCVNCGHACEHVELTDEGGGCVPNGDGTHVVNNLCVRCGTDVPVKEEDCGGYDDGYCVDCNGVCPHTHTTTLETKYYHDAVANTHILGLKCSDCGLYVTAFSSPQACEYENCVCKVCGGESHKTILDCYCVCGKAFHYPGCPHDGVDNI